MFENINGLGANERRFGGVLQPETKPAAFLGWYGNVNRFFYGTTNDGCLVDIMNISLPNGYQ